MSLFATQTSKSIAALGESRLIESIQRWLGPTSPRPPFGIGDDCAVIHSRKTRQLITVDPVIFGVHFDQTVPPINVGIKLFNRNLSDIAAMGGKPLAAVVALAIDERVRIVWLKEFYRGLARVSKRYQVPIVGGDIARHRDGFVATLTLLGEPKGKRILTRHGASIGDSIFVTGSLGGSLASGHHFRFRPRLDEGAWLAGQKAVVAMMDLSDGLAKDIASITPSGAMPSILRHRLPLRKGCSLRQALCDGEDYELLFVVGQNSNDRGLEARWKSSFPKVPLNKIGAFISKDTVESGTIDLSEYRGYEHLR